MSIRARSARYLSATVVAAAVSIVTLPLTTKVLGPSAYGLFALGGSLAGVGASIATLGMTFVLAKRWTVAGRNERRRIVGTLLTIGLAITVGWAIIVGSIYLALRDHVGFLGALTPGEMGFALGGLLISPLWMVASDILTVEGGAGVYAGVTIMQSIATAAATLTALFAFDLGTLSLFIGIFVGALVASAASVVYLRDYLSLGFDRTLRGELAQTTFLLAQAAETVQSVVERILLSRFVGYTNLGLFVHSRRYRDLAMQGTTAVTRGVWPVTLDEAKDPTSSFAATARTWRTVYVGLTAASLVATAFGDQMISVLTHDKFTPAWKFLTPWFALLLVQLSAKPEVGTMYAFGRARAMGRISLVSNTLGIVAAAALIPWVGAWGALVALVLQGLCYRIGVRLPARRLRPVPFQDTWAIAGCVTLIVAWVAKLVLEPGLGGDLVLLVAAEALWLGAAAVVSPDVFAALRVRPSAAVAPDEPSGLLSDETVLTPPVASTQPESPRDR